MQLDTLRLLSLIPRGDQIQHTVCSIYVLPFLFSEKAEDFPVKTNKKTLKDTPFSLGFLAANSIFVRADDSVKFVVNRLEDLAFDLIVSEFGDVE